MRRFQLIVLVFFIHICQSWAEDNLASYRKIRLEGSLSRVSNNSNESSGLFNFHQGFSGEQSYEAEVFRSNRFDSTNSQFSMKYENSAPSGIVYSFGGSTLIEEALTIHLPYSSLVASLEHPLLDWGSGTGDVQTKFYSTAQVLIFSYGVVIERVDSWLIIPKVFLSHTELTHSSGQSMDAAFGLRLAHRISNFDSSISFSTGQEAYSAESGVRSMGVKSIGLSLKYLGYKSWIPDFSYQWETRSEIKRSSHMISMGVEVSSW